MTATPVGHVLYAAIYTRTHAPVFCSYLPYDGEWCPFISFYISPFIRSSMQQRQKGRRRWGGRTGPLDRGTTLCEQPLEAGSEKNEWPALS